MKKILFLFSLGLGPLTPALAQTVVNLSNTVTNPDPLPFGLNWSEANSSRDLTALNNHTGDPGFGRQIIRLKGICDGGSDTYAEHTTDPSTDYYQTLYTGMFDGGEIRVYRETPTGITLVRTSTIINFYADDLAPNHHRITFASGPTVQAGDIYVISREANADLNQYCHPRLTWVRNGNNTWSKNVDDQDGLGNEADVTKELSTDVPPNGGTTSCKIRNTNPNNREVGIGQYFSNSPESGEFSFEPAKTYRFTVWLKQTGIAGGTVNLKSSGTGINHNFTVTGTWQQYTFDVSGVQPIVNGGAVDFLRLTFNGVGTLWIDNFTLHDASYPLFALSPAIERELKNFKPYNLRIWSGQTNQELGTNIGDWTDTELQSARLWSPNQGPVTGAALKLPTVLPLCEANSIAPYLICSPSFSEADFLGLMEYLGGPSTTPYGAKRAAQGHPTPYTARMPKIYIELGNETWNQLFAPWDYNFNGQRYGKFAQYFYNIIKSSPYYDANKFELLLGGFLVTADQYGYGQQAVTQAPDGKQMMLANYVGGFDGLNIPSSPAFADSVQQTAFYARWITRNIINDHLATRDQLAASGKPYKLGIYEAGPGYALPDPTNPFDLQAERIGKSLGCAVANLDAFLYQSEKGFGVQNLFLFARGFNWTSHTAESQGLRPHNHFLALQMRNRFAKGAMITTTVTGSPTTYLPLIDGNGNGTYDSGYGEAPAGNYENIAAYSFKNADEFSVFVLNRSVTANTPVTFNLPAGATMDSLRLYKLTGDPTGNNIRALNYQIQQQRFEIPANSTSYSFTMPAGSIYLFTTKKSNLPLSSSGAKAAAGTLSVFPNPAADYLTLQAPNATSGPVEILNSTGQRVLRQQVYRPGQQLHVGTLPPGVYSVRFAGAASKFVIK
ncbi:T9SS type A sorting domain-containing protein [Hymenobacter sp. BT664]|uniref:T9SS type A sorting domain-containing protein n=1 Tax=Hymenobacter montanus TaxID=2771359 RepID=A0A927BB31_9BACT|nr:T9SS type A sorting domain-containing protein [Hymenobacter montanus]MBD2766909.1 T9SS type A sorting domain-containing protein [Hymenobacter montanus]